MTASNPTYDELGEARSFVKAMVLPPGVNPHTRRLLLRLIEHKMSDVLRDYLESEAKPGILLRQPRGEG